MEKYELTGETQTLDDGFRKVVLNRIRALKDFGDVKAGDTGGWIECRNNLSQEGDVWVYGDARVYGNAKICDNARIYDKARIHDNAVVCGNTFVCDKAEIYDNATVYGRAKVYDKAIVCGRAKVYDNATVYDNAEVYGGAEVYGKAEVYGRAKVCDNAEVYMPGHLLLIGAIDVWNDFTTFYKSRDNQIMVKCRCFSGTLDKFLRTVDKTYGISHYADVYRAAAKVAELQIGLLV